ncbi:MAG: hypothetical protein AAB544_01585 [Patescibacteria group bacterium]
MMTTTGLGYGIFSGWALHWAFGTFWIIGAILFVVWAMKNLSGAALRNWAIGLFVVGIIGAVITAPADVAVWRTVLGGRSMMDGDMMGRMMQMMMEHDETNPDAEHDEIEGMMRDVLRGNENSPGMMR